MGGEQFVAFSTEVLEALGGFTAAGSKLHHFKYLLAEHRFPSPSWELKVEGMRWMGN
jgi:hypothetical protein